VERAVGEETQLTLRSVAKRRQAWNHSDFSPGARVFSFLWLWDENMNCRQATDRHRLYAHYYVCASHYYWTNCSVFHWIEVISEARYFLWQNKEYLLFICLLKYLGPSLSTTVTIGSRCAREAVHSTVPTAKQQLTRLCTKELRMWVVFRYWQSPAISE